MHPQAPLRDAERDNYAFFLDLPETARVDLPKVDHKTSQFLEPLFEYSGACAGCGETPYIKLLTQLFGDRASGGERHGLLVDLRRQPADHAVHDQPRRPRTGVVELALRGQRGIRPRHAASASTVIPARRARWWNTWPGPIGERLTHELLDADQSTEAGSGRSASACSRCDRCSRLSPRPKHGRLEGARRLTS
jgi:pyruvate-ferredoxin/flavodoxin oxidoreductase